MVPQLRKHMFSLGFYCFLNILPDISHHPCSWSYVFTYLFLKMQVGHEFIFKMLSQTAKLQSKVKELIDICIQNVNSQNYIHIESQSLGNYCIISVKIKPKISHRHIFKGVLRISSEEEDDMKTLEEFFNFLTTF